MGGGISGWGWEPQLVVGTIAAGEGGKGISGWSRGSHSCLGGWEGSQVSRGSHKLLGRVEGISGWLWEPQLPGREEGISGW